MASQILPTEPGSRGQATEKDGVGRACGPSSQSQETKGTELFFVFCKNILEEACPVDWEKKIKFPFIFYL